MYNNVKNTILRRKIDSYLKKWKNDLNKLPLVVKGARQVGKTESIRYFANNNYKSVVEINFILNEEYLDIFANGYDVDTIIKNISFKNTSFKFIPNETLIFFDEMQKCPNVATCLKSFAIDKRYDVICSGSLMGINYNEIESNSVGYKTDYEMHSMDFEEFLWASGYTEEHINEIASCIKNLIPLNESILTKMFEKFDEYMVVGGMPHIVDTFVKNKNYQGILEMQKQILYDYEEDITKYAGGLDKAKVLNVYRNITTFLAKENKKFQITKVTVGARNREYVGVIDWLKNAGIVNVCYCLSNLELPLKGNYDFNKFKLYFADTGLLIGSLDEESSKDLRHNHNYNTYRGAIYENIVAEMLKKQGYDLYFYKNETSTVEMDFFIRNEKYLIPIEVKATDNPTRTLRNMIEDDKYKDIKYGIKFCRKNIGFNGKFYTFPYFTAFLLKQVILNK